MNLYAVPDSAVCSVACLEWWWWMPKKWPAGVGPCSSKPELKPSLQKRLETGQYVEEIS
ncbi:MAG: hypothetical protein RJR35_14310 [Thermoanaerobacterales bacterium]|nr:hypothetical protein [Thermoanaerobacterales bacterium]